MILWTIWLLLTLLLFAGSWLGRRAFLEAENSIAYPFKLRLFAQCAWFAMDKMQLAKRFSGYLVKVHEQLAVLYGGKHTRELTQFYMAESLAISCVCLEIGALLAAAAEDASLTAVGLITACSMPLLAKRRLLAMVERRKRSIILELPDVLNKMVLLVNAGETAQGAFLRASQTSSADAPSSALRKELALTVHELQMNISFAKALEQLSRRCASPDVSMFTTTLLLNYKRGGDELVLALRALSKEMWDRRKAVSRTLGEEASSKLVFPMVIIFLIVMVIVGAPAMLMLNE